MRCDYLVLRLHPAPAKPIQLAATLPSGLMLAGRALLDLHHCGAQVGHLATVHGGIHLHLPGGFWRRSPCLLEAQDPQADLTALQVYLSSVLSPTTVSVPRIDYVCELPAVDDALTQVATVAQSVIDRWPGRYPATETRRSDSGLTVYIGVAGNDPDGMRSRSPYVRVYHRYGSGVVRAEAELKGIDGATAQLQVQTALVIATVLLGHLSVEHHPAPSVGNLPARRVVPNHELAARLIGSLYNRLYQENGGTLPPSVVRVAEGVCRVLGVSTQMAHDRRPKTAEPIGEEKP